MRTIDDELSRYTNNYGDTLTITEVEHRLATYRELVYYCHSVGGNSDIEPFAEFDLDTGEWVVDEDNDRSRFPHRTPHGEILVWIVKRLYEDVPY